MIKKLKNKILFLIFVLLIGTPSAMAMTRGELRYQITELTVYDSEITFEGWAMIGGMHNGRDQNGNNLGQTISIRGVDEDGNYWPDARGVSVNGGGSWNFYYQHYYAQNLSNKANEAYNAYYGNFVPGWSNNCIPSGNATVLESQCFYEKLGFSITLDVGDWDVDNTRVHFEMLVSNNNGSAGWEQIGVLRDTPGNWSSTDYIKVDSGTFSNKVEALVDDGILGVNGGKKHFEGKGYAIVAPGYVYEVDGGFHSGGSTRLGDGPGWYNIRVDMTPSTCTLQEGTVRTACFLPEGMGSDNDNYDDSSGYQCKITGNPACRSCASTGCPDILGNASLSGANVNIGSKSGGWTYITDSSYGYGGCWVANVSGSPPYSCSGGGSSSGSSSGGSGSMSVWASWMKPKGSLYIIATGSKKCEVTRPNVNAACNSGGNSFSSDCEELTVKKKDGNGNIVASGNVSVSESAFASVILSPTETFIGGGFKFGVLYNNKISWNI